jgi:hypothetical protein
MQGNGPALKRAAHRVLGDLDFAQAILEGREKYPEIRTAILADLAAAAQMPVDEYERVMMPSADATVLQHYVENGPKPGGMSVYEFIERASTW